MQSGAHALTRRSRHHPRLPYVACGIGLPAHARCVAAQVGAQGLVVVLATALHFAAHSELHALGGSLAALASKLHCARPHPTRVSPSQTHG
ncbi:Uncharacterised protein [Vibrio cholerae]|nr:Uncharacterised protein [Vibrio cholerae]